MKHNLDQRAPQFFLPQLKKYWGQPPFLFNKEDNLIKKKPQHVCQYKTTWILLTYQWKTTNKNVQLSSLLNAIICTWYYFDTIWNNDQSIKDFLAYGLSNSALVMLMQVLWGCTGAAWAQTKNAWWLHNMAELHSYVDKLDLT